MGLVADDAGLITGVTRKKTPISGKMATHPGVYCLRSNEMDWDEERMWRTYTVLTDLESVFRSLKPVLSEAEGSEQGWRRCSTRRRIAPMATYSSPFWPTKSSIPCWALHSLLSGEVVSGCRLLPCCNIAALIAAILGKVLNHG